MCTAKCVELIGKDYYVSQTKFNQLVEENVHVIINLPTQAYFSDIRVTNISKSFTYKTVAETSWHTQIDRRVLPSGTLSQSLDFKKFRNGTSTVTSVVILVQQMTAASLSY